MKNIYRLSLVIITFIMFCGCAGTKSEMIKAANSGDLDTIKNLRDVGKNINEHDGAGTTALMYAVCAKKSDVAKYLIESGADIKAKDRNYYDALLYAVDYKQLEIMNILIGKGADIESKDSYGRTPLHHAIWNTSDIDSVRLLIKKGANVNAKDRENITLLDSALELKGRMDIVSELVNAGAKLFEPEDGKARLFFVTEGEFWRDVVQISVGNEVKDMNAGEMRFIDVSPGASKIVLNISKVFTNPELSVNAELGETYYFNILPSDYHKAGRVLGVIAGPLAWTATNVASGGVFKIVPLEESMAKEKIKALLR